MFASIFNAKSPLTVQGRASNGFVAQIRDLTTKTAFFPFAAIAITGVLCIYFTIAGKNGLSAM
jgi:hypothetical protein